MSESKVAQPQMTMREIDRRRELANAAIGRVRALGADALDRFDLEAREADVLEALHAWWRQDCREIPDLKAGCPCGKVAVKPGEDPLVAWCAAGHPVNADGSIAIPGM